MVAHFAQQLKPLPASHRHHSLLEIPSLPLLAASLICSEGYESWRIAHQFCGAVRSETHHRIGVHQVAIGRISGSDRPHIHSVTLAKKSSVPESWEGEGSSYGTQAASDVESGLETIEPGETDPARHSLSNASAGMQAIRTRLIAIRSAYWDPPSVSVETPRNTSQPENGPPQAVGRQQWVQTTHRQVPFDVVDITKNDSVAESSDLQHRLP